MCSAVTFELKYASSWLVSWNHWRFKVSITQMREPNTCIFTPPLTKALTAIVAFVLVAISSSGECCQTGKTMYDIVSRKNPPPEKVEPITEWKEVAVPPCEFWLCRKENGYRWTLKNVGGEIDVEWYPLSDGQKKLTFDSVEYDKKVTLPEAGYPLIYSSNEPTVTVNTGEGTRDVPRAAFEYEHEDGFFFVAEPYTCSPTKLLFYPKSGEPGWGVDAYNIRRIIGELDGSLWGISGYAYLAPIGNLVQISKGPTGEWSSKKVASFQAFPLVALRLDDERAIAATDRSIEMIEDGGLEVLWEDLSGELIVPTSMVQDDQRVVYIAVNQGVFKIAGIDSLFGPEVTLLVPDETYLEYPETCFTRSCEPKPGWIKKTLARELRSPYAWIMGIWFLLTTALGAWMLVKRFSHLRRR